MKNVRAGGNDGYIVVHITSDHPDQGIDEDIEDELSAADMTAAERIAAVSLAGVIPALLGVTDPRHKKTLHMARHV